MSQSSDIWWKTSTLSAKHSLCLYSCNSCQVSDSCSFLLGGGGAIRTWCFIAYNCKYLSILGFFLTHVDGRYSLSIVAQWQDRACKCFRFHRESKWEHFRYFEDEEQFPFEEQSKELLCSIFILLLLSLLHFYATEKCKYWKLSWTDVGAGVKVGW